MKPNIITLEMYCINEIASNVNDKANADVAYSGVHGRRSQFKLT